MYAEFHLEAMCSWNKCILPLIFLSKFGFTTNRQTKIYEVSWHAHERAADGRTLYCLCDIRAALASHQVSILASNEYDEQEQHIYAILGKVIKRCPRLVAPHNENMFSLHSGSEDHIRAGAHHQTTLLKAFPHHPNNRSSTTTNHSTRSWDTTSRSIGLQASREEQRCPTFDISHHQNMAPSGEYLIVEWGVSELTL